LFACTGLLFNHESPLRPRRFVTQKIINGAEEIAAGNLNSMVLGNLEITRDWGWAPEYVEAMWMMLQTSSADDYVIATGTSYSLGQFVEKVFSSYGLDWGKYIQVDKSFFRPLDIHISKADPSKAQKQLGWQAKATLDEVIGKMKLGVY
jgi:GDPmannose 4,6-dehydratase